MELEVKLEGAKLEKATAFLRDNWGNFKCEVCQTDDWVAMDTVYELHAFAKGAFLGGPVIPVVPLCCKRCGNIKMFSAMLSGLIESPPGPPSQPAVSKPENE